MESSLHQQLKRRYASSEAETEVKVGSFRVDAVRDDELIEVQCASLSAIRAKAERLLRRHRLRIVKPIFVRKRIRRLSRVDGKQLSRRMSPKRGSVVDLFDDLIYFTRVFPHPNLTLELPLVHVEETRVPRRRRRRWHADHRVVDVSLETVEQHLEIQEPADLLELIGWREPPRIFTTADVASAIDRPRWFAQKVAYVLRHTGAIRARERKRSGVIYEPATAATARADAA